MHSSSRLARVSRWSTATLIAAVLAIAPVGIAAAASDPTPATSAGLNVEVTLDASVSSTPITGRLLFLVARGNDPLDYVGVDGSTLIFGQNVTDFSPGSTVSMQGGGAAEAVSGVYGYPYESLADLPDGDYSARAVLVRYDSFSRSDGSKVDLYQPCGDGGQPLYGPGTLTSDVMDFTVYGGMTGLHLTLNQARTAGATSPEIGGCHQGNYTDHDNVRYIKIRSTALSNFWGTDVYVGANVQLPRDYDPSRAEAYPVIYSQSHWPGDGTPFWGYGDDSRFILVTIRQESTFYDDAYSVNSANLGPWGDAIADELVPEIDRQFHTIAAPYGRLQEGGSTGGWTSLASVLFRPDVFGATWSYYPDSLDFHAHQAVDLYNDTNAYIDGDGNVIPSWRSGITMPQENHYELALGTNSRSFDQWDIWNAVFGPQGYNGYPLDPWDKVTGTIDHDTAHLWQQQFDLTAYLRKNWTGARNLGSVLKDRIHVSVGTEDDYYLTGGVEHFKSTVEELGGTDWAEIHIVPGQGHGGYFNYMSLTDQLDQMWTWVQNHAPDGSEPLSAEATAAAARGNLFSDVMAWGGRAAAIARQADPKTGVTSATVGDTVTADFGAWDPGMALIGQWTLNGSPLGDPIDLGTPRLADVAAARATHTVTDAEAHAKLAFQVTGTKRGYTTETRSTSEVALTAAPSPTPAPTPSGTASPQPTPSASPILAATAPSAAVSASQVESGGVVRVTVTGVEAGEQVSAELHSDPIRVTGIPIADANGKVSFDVPIPATLSIGAHTIVVFAADGTQIARLPIMVVAPGTLAVTGAQAPLGAALVGALLLVVGVGASVLRRPRRQISGGGRP